MGNQLKHLLIILSILLLSSPVIGQSTPKYESVSQCVLQTMKENKLTGNEMFKMVKEECERILGELEDKKRGVLYNRKVNGEYGWYKSGDEKKDGKYVGEIDEGVPNGQGTYTFSNGEKYVGEFKDGRSNGLGKTTTPDGRKYEGIWKNWTLWNGKQTDKDGNIIREYVNGDTIYQ
jgi:hypothetical protein